MKGGVADRNSHVMDFREMQVRYQNILIDTNDVVRIQKNSDDDDDLHKKSQREEREFIFSTVCIIELPEQTDV